MGTALGMKPTALHRHSQLISRGHSNANIGYQGLQPTHLAPHPLGAVPHRQPSLGGSPLRHKSQPFSPLPIFFFHLDIFATANTQRRSRGKEGTGGI